MCFNSDRDDKDFVCADCDAARDNDNKELILPDYDVVGKVVIILFSHCAATDSTLI